MILRAFALGLSTGAFCLGYCFPIVAPLLLARADPSVKGMARALGLFLSGRLIAYLLAGVAVGIIGGYTKEAVFFQRRIVPVSFIVLGGLMVLYGLLTFLPQRALCGLSAQSFGKDRHLFIAGFLAGINLCPPFVLAFSYAIGFGGVARSVLFFFFFFIATALYMLPFLCAGFASRYELVRTVARLASAASGVWFVAMGVGRLL